MTKLDKPVSKMKQGHIMLMPEKRGKKGPLVKENLHISSLRCIDLKFKKSAVSKGIKVYFHWYNDQFIGNLGC